MEKPKVMGGNAGGGQAEISEGVFTLLDENKKVVAVVSVRNVNGTGYPKNSREYWDVVVAHNGDTAYEPFPNLKGGGTPGVRTAMLRWVYSGGWSSVWGNDHPPFPPAHHKWDAAGDGGEDGLGGPGVGGYVGANGAGVTFDRWVHMSFLAKRDTP